MMKKIVLILFISLVQICIAQEIHIKNVKLTRETLPQKDNEPIYIGHVSINYEITNNMKDTLYLLEDYIRSDIFYKDNYGGMRFYSGEIICETDFFKDPNELVSYDTVHDTVFTPRETIFSKTIKIPPKSKKEFSISSYVPRFVCADIDKEKEIIFQVLYLPIYSKFDKKRMKKWLKKRLKKRLKKLDSKFDENDKKWMKKWLKKLDENDKKRIKNLEKSKKNFEKLILSIKKNMGLYSYHHEYKDFVSLIKSYIVEYEEKIRDLKIFKKMYLKDLKSNEVNLE